jgi:hypothetical protein
MPVGRLDLARHMSDAMSSTPQPPRPLRLNRTKAELVPVAQFARWHERASATVGLTELDHQVLDTIVEYDRQLAQRVRSVGRADGAVRQGAQYRHHERHQASGWVGTGRCSAGFRRAAQ